MSHVCWPGRPYEGDVLLHLVLGYTASACEALWRIVGILVIVGGRVYFRVETSVVHLLGRIVAIFLTDVGDRVVGL